jgi:hypothetical protein
MQSIVAAVIGFTLLTAAASASPLTVELKPVPGNPAAPRMGDHLAFHSVITNTGQQPVDGVMAWVSLLKVDPGREQPVDLEDWSAQKAITRAALPPGGTIETDWPMRLIEDGHYRLLVSAASRGGEFTTSPLVDFYVRPKPVVESARVLPIAFGIPLLIAGLLLLRSGVFPAIASIRPGWRSIRP